MQPKPHSALVISGHGSSINPDSSAPTLAHAETIRQRALFNEVITAFWKEPPALNQVLALVKSPDIYVVPNFISEGYFTRKIIPREMNLTGRLTWQGERFIKYCDPVGNHPRMTELLLHRASSVAPGIPASQTSLIIVGHGTTKNDHSADAVNEQVKKIAARHLYAEVIATFMEQSPFISEWRELTTQPNVVVVPFFISDGLHSYQDIPVLLGIETEPGEAASRREIFRTNPHQIHGRTLYYSSAIGTDLEFADLILEQVEAFDKKE